MLNIIQIKPIPKELRGYEFSRAHGTVVPADALSIVVADKSYQFSKLEPNDIANMILRDADYDGLVVCTPPITRDGVQRMFRSMKPAAASQLAAA